MSTPVEIDFRAWRPSPPFAMPSIKHIASFEKRFGPIAAGRVVLKSPHGENAGGRTI